MKNMQWLIAALALALNGSTWAEGDANTGQKKSEMCASCHGKAGNSETPIFPKLAGQHAGYLLKQLRDFRAQKRIDPTMNAIVGGLSDKDMIDVVAYYAAQKISPESPPSTIAGRHLYIMGHAANGVAACTGCHGPDGRGNGPAHYPALAGQNSAYIAKTLADFKSQARSNDNNGVMHTIAAKLSAEEINAVADYIAGLAGTKRR